MNFAMTRLQWRRWLGRIMPGGATPKVKRAPTGRAKERWVCEGWPGRPTFYVGEAHTKSEARAILKKAPGVGRGGLPVGVRLVGLRQQRAAAVA